MHAISCSRSQPQASSAYVPSQVTQRTPQTKLSREKAIDELTARFQQFIQPNGQLLSEPRATRAAALLVNSLQQGELNLTSPGPTLSALFQADTDNILPVLDRLCRAETGHGIRSVSLDAGLTSQLHANHPTRVHAGLKALTNLQELTLQPWEGELDLLYFPSVRTVILDMCEADAATEMDVLAWKRTSVIAHWSQVPEKASRVHLYAPGRPPQTMLIEAVLIMPGLPMLSTGTTSALTAAKPRLATQNQATAPRSILAFMRGEATAPEPAPQRGGEIPNKTVVLSAKGKGDMACWIKVNALGQIDVVLMDAQDHAEASQVIYRVTANVEMFAGELAKTVGVDAALPLDQVLDVLAASSVDVNAFHAWLKGTFELVPNDH